MFSGSIYLIFFHYTCISKRCVKERDLRAPSFHFQTPIALRTVLAALGVIGLKMQENTQENDILCTCFF